jgi:hypothetical protein
MTGFGSYGCGEGVWGCFAVVVCHSERSGSRFLRGAESKNPEGVGWGSGDGRFRAGVFGVRGWKLVIGMGGMGCVGILRCAQNDRVWGVWVWGGSLRCSPGE